MGSPALLRAVTVGWAMTHLSGRRCGGRLLLIGPELIRIVRKQVNLIDARDLKFPDNQGTGVVTLVVLADVGEGQPLYLDELHLRTLHGSSPCHSMPRSAFLRGRQNFGRVKASSTDQLIRVLSLKWRSYYQKLADLNKNKSPGPRTS